MFPFAQNQADESSDENNAVNDQQANPVSNEGVSASQADVARRSARALGSLSTFPDLLNVQNSSKDSPSNKHLTHHQHHQSPFSRQFSNESGSNSCPGSAVSSSQSRETGAIPKRAHVARLPLDITSQRSTGGTSSQMASIINVPSSSSSLEKSTKAGSSSNAASSSLVGSCNLSKTSQQIEKSKATNTQHQLSSGQSNELILNQMQEQIDSLVSSMERVTRAVDQLSSQINQRLDLLESRISSVRPALPSSPGSVSSVEYYSSLINEHRKVSLQKAI